MVNYLRVIRYSQDEEKSRDCLYLRKETFRGQYEIISNLKESNVKSTKVIVKNILEYSKKVVIKNNSKRLITMHRFILITSKN